MNKKTGKKSILRLITAREIKKSFGRFFAIFAIIALGVGFFAGLRITTPVMIRSVDRFYRDSQLYDYRLVSTLGWKEKEVEAFRSKENVRAAEGAWQYDVIVETDAGESAVYRVHSVTARINEVRLKEGRLPEAEDECLMDASNRMGLHVGDTLSFSKENDSGTLEAFSRRDYTVVGFTDAALYVNFERGTTSIGNGTIAGYLYLPKKAFAEDYYTEIYVKLNSDDEIYSEAYTAEMDSGRNEWEALTQQKADERYDDLYTEASEKIADAKEEFHDKKADGEKELSDAKAELDDAETGLKDAEKEISDGKQELTDAAQKLADGKKELDNAAKELTEGRNQLSEAARQLEAVRQQLDASRGELNSAKTQLDETAAQLDEGAQALTAGYQELQENKALLDATAVTLEESAKKLAESKAQIEWAEAAGSMTGEQAAAAWAEYNAGVQRYEAGKAAYEGGLQKYRAGVQEYETSKAAYEAGLQQYKAGKAAYEEGLRQYTDGVKQYEEGRAKYEASAARYKAGLAEYQSGLASYKQGIADYESGKADYENGVKEYEDGRKKYEDGVKEYEDGKETFDKEVADAEKKIADAEQKLKDIERPDTYLLERNTNIAYSCFESDSQIIKQVAAVFPLFFILVAVLVCMTTMTRMVEEQRGQIGVLKGLGYSVGDIMKGFLVYAGLAAALGCVVGYALGVILFPTVIWYAYETMYIRMPARYFFDPALFAGVFAAAMGCSLGTTYLSCVSVLRESAASLMRPKAPKAGKRVFLEYIPAIWKRMTFMRKVTVRNIFRYKKRLFMMILGIGGCMALLIAGFGIKDSISSFSEAQFDTIQVADAEVIFRHGKADKLPDDITEALGDLGAGYLPTVRQTWDALMKKRVKSVNVVAFYGNAGTADTDAFFRLRDFSTGERLQLPEAGEALVSASISKRYGYKVGDTLALRNDDMAEMTVTVSGVFENYVNNYVLISAETLRRATGKADVNGMYVSFAEDRDIYEAQTRLASCENTASVSILRDFRSRLRDMMESLNYVVLLVIASAGGLAFVVLYNLTNINIIERIREIATIKVLGFYRRETSDYIFRENLILTVMGAAAGIVLGILLHRFVMSKIVYDLVFFPVKIRPVSFVYSVVLTFAFTVFVNVVMSAKLEKINMAESLKAVE